MQDVIFPVDLALQALRSTSYKNTAHAVAELIDNSFDAGATNICVALLTETENGQPHSIAVLDDGRGMSRGTLRKSIQYGFSGQGSTSGKPLGKFGVGLVAATFSQCSDLTVMSWQDNEASVGSVDSTGIKLHQDRINDNSLPEPSIEQLPSWAYHAFLGMETPIGDMETGTLIVWREVDSSWKKADTLLDNLKGLCGRVYRNFISDGRLTISINVFDISQNKVTKSSTIPAVDPMFLTNWADDALSSDGFVGDNTLFDPYTGIPGDPGRNQSGSIQSEQTYDVESFDGKTIGTVLLNASYRSERVLSDKLDNKYNDPGDAPYGILAKRLEGISILRSEREIDLDPSWLRLSKTVDRWVSVSLDFDPDLDEYFGLSNDKQRAHRLAETARLSKKEIQDKINELREEDDPDDKLFVCLSVALQIKKRLSAMQAIVQNQRKNSRSRNKSGTKDPSMAPVEELVSAGNALLDGRTRIPQDDASPRDYPEETADVYENSTSDGQPAKKVRPPIVIEHNLQVDIVADQHGISNDMFRVGGGPAHIVVHLISRHPLYGKLFRLLLDEADRDPGEEEPTIQDALRVIRGLIISYARAMFEAETYNPNLVSEFQRCLSSWSEVGTRLFEDSDE